MKSKNENQPKMNEMRSLNTLGVHEVSKHVSVPFSNVYKKVELNTFLHYSPNFIDVRTTDNIDASAISKAFVDKATRVRVIELLGDISQLSSLLDEILVTKNKQVRLENAMTDVTLIAEKVNKMFGKDTIGTQFAIVMIIGRALKNHGLLLSSSPIANILDDSVSPVDLPEITKFIHENFLIGALVDMRFKRIDGSVTNTMLIASNIADAMAEFRMRLISLDSLDEAINSVIPRVRAYILKDLETVYTASEINMMMNPDFQMLCSNYDIVKLALAQSQTKPMVHASFWREHDKLLVSALTNLTGKVNISSANSFIDMFSFTRVKDKIGRAKALILTQNEQHVKNIRCIYTTKVGSFSEFRDYPIMEAPLTTLSNWFNSELNTNMITSMFDVMANQFIFTESNPHNVVIGDVDSIKLEKLAVILADEVYVSSEDGSLLYKVDISKGVDGLVDYPVVFFSKDVHSVLFCLGRPMTGKTVVDYSAQVPLKSGVRYLNLAGYTDQIGNNQITVPTMCYDKQGSKLRVNISLKLSDALGFAVPPSLALACHRGAAQLCNMFNEMYIALSTYTADSSGRKSFKDSKEMIELILARALGEKVRKLHNDPFIIGVANLIRDSLMSNDEVLRDALFYDTKLDFSIKSAAVLFVIKLFGALEDSNLFSSTYAELIDKYLALEV